jgi:fermentation-respiration switch protein FrsA (DUF1100 family)
MEHVKHVRCPVLVIHSPDDILVPYSQGVALYEAAAEPKAFIKLRGGHNDALFLSAEEYRTGLEAFLKKAGR